MVDLVRYMSMSLDCFIAGPDDNAMRMPALLAGARRAGTSGSPRPGELVPPMTGDARLADFPASQAKAGSRLCCAL